MKKIFLSLFCIFSLTGIFAPVPVFAATADSEVCAGLSEVSGNDCDAAAGADRINRILRIAINIFSVVLGIIAVIMVIIAGLTIATSGGDSSKITRARESLITVSVGIAVIVFAQILVHFVLRKA